MDMAGIGNLMSMFGKGGGKPDFNQILNIAGQVTGKKISKEDITREFNKIQETVKAEIVGNTLSYTMNGMCECYPSSVKDLIKENAGRDAKEDAIFELIDKSLKKFLGKLKAEDLDKIYGMIKERK